MAPICRTESVVHNATMAVLLEGLATGRIQGSPCCLEYREDEEEEFSMSPSPLSDGWRPSLLGSNTCLYNLMHAYYACLSYYACLLCMLIMIPLSLLSFFSKSKEDHGCGGSWG